jgi:NhaA family Na+:H+ antiporter
MPAILSRTFTAFFDSEKVGGLLLIICTLVSLVIANSPVGPAYGNIWDYDIAGLTLTHWVNDGLMAIFFLIVGLELEHCSRFLPLSAV